MPILTDNLTVRTNNKLDKSFQKAIDEEICCTQLFPMYKRFLFNI